ncbi:MAG TPA: hypothetical protein GX744_04965 [Firmicutes bacterium]|nr:hypothetical protein [Bacillota bacterium]
MFARNQRGLVLVVVMVAMAALLILGGTLSTVALSDQRQAIRQQKNNEAYYLARSGAEAVEAVLIKDISNINSYLGQTTECELGNGRFEASVVDGGDGTIVIESTGYAGVFSERVTLRLMPQCAPYDPPEETNIFLPIFDMAVFSSSEIRINSGSPTIYGRAGTNSVSQSVYLNNAGGYRITEDLYIGAGGLPAIVVPNHREKVGGEIIELDRERYYPLPEFPDFPDNLAQRGDLSTNDVSRVISQDGYYERIDVYKPLTIDVGDGVRTIRVKKLTCHGWENSKIKLTGSGILKLYIDEDFILLSSSQINNEGDPAQAAIYYRGDADITFAGDAKVFACLFSYSDKADFYLKGSGGINGVVFLKGKKVGITGGTVAIVSVLYAPNAEVRLTGGGSLSGAIVCDSFFADGGTKVVYDAGIEEIWEQVPEMGFDFGTDPGESSDPGESPGAGEPGAGSGSDTVDGYTRVWSD